MNRSITLFLLLIVIMACNGSPDIEKDETALDYTTETVVTGIPFPWGMDWLPNGEMLITNRDGELYYFSEIN